MSKSVNPIKDRMVAMEFLHHAENLAFYTTWCPFATRVSLKQMGKVNPTFHKDPKEFEKVLDGSFCFLGGGFEYFLFSSLPGEKWSHLANIFQVGWNHQLGFVSFLEEFLRIFFPKLVCC